MIASKAVIRTAIGETTRPMVRNKLLPPALRVTDNVLGIVVIVFFPIFMPTLA